MPGNNWDTTTPKDRPEVVITDEGTDKRAQVETILSKERLLVDATIAGEVPTIPSLGTNLHYEDMNVANGGVARDSDIGSTFVKMFSYSGSGLIMGFLVTLEGGITNWNIRLVIDGVEIFGSNGISTTDLSSDVVYNFDSGEGNFYPIFIGWQFRKNTWRWQGPLNLPVTYTSSVDVYLKYVGGGTKAFKAGLIGLVKD